VEFHQKNYHKDKRPEILKHFISYNESGDNFGVLYRRANAEKLKYISPIGIYGNSSDQTGNFI
jgi:hypothetical protein